MPSFLIATNNQFKLFQKGKIDESLNGTIDLILRWITSDFERYCRRSFTKQSRTEHYTVRHTRASLFLKHWPIDPIVTVKVWASPDRIFDDTTLLKSTDYYIDRETGEMTLLAPTHLLVPGETVTPIHPSWPIGHGVVQVEYTGGWLISDGLGAPDDLQMAGLIQSSFLFQRRSELGLVSRSGESVVTPSLENSRVLAALIPADSTLLASLARVRPLGAAMTVTSSVAADLQRLTGYASAISAVSAMGAVVAIARELVASLEATGTMAGATSVSRPLAAEMAAMTALTASLTLGLAGKEPHVVVDVLARTFVVLASDRIYIVETQEGKG